LRPFLDAVFRTPYPLRLLTHPRSTPKKEESAPSNDVKTTPVNDLEKEGVIVLPWITGMKAGAGYDSLTQVVKGDAYDTAWCVINHDGKRVVSSQTRDSYRRLISQNRPERRVSPQPVVPLPMLQSVYQPVSRMGQDPVLQGVPQVLVRCNVL
jgi:hypothetical protein